MTMNNTYLSVIIPAYNEEENLKKGVLDQLNQYLTLQDYSWEVLIIDDASTDSTAKLAGEYSKKHSKYKVFKEVHRGKGGNIIAGMKRAKGEIVLFTDMDQATPINQIKKILPRFADGYDVVIGQRVGRKGAPLTRQIMAYGFVLLRKIVLGLPYKDTQCGFKAFKKDVAEKIFSNMEVFGSLKENLSASVTAGFDIEVLYLAKKLGFKVAEVKVDWNYKETERVSAVHDSLEALRDMFKIRLYSLMGKYNV